MRAKKYIKKSLTVDVPCCSAFDSSFEKCIVSRKLESFCILIEDNDYSDKPFKYNRLGENCPNLRKENLENM